jgi:DNA-binding transcriptional ArsR family regulator
MNETDDRLDRAFAALADPVRRAIVARLSRGSATLGELAEPFEISLQAVSKHISVLEDAGLVWRTREAQRKPVHLDAAALERLTAWIDRYRLEAERAYRRLDAVLATARALGGTSAEPAGDAPRRADLRPDNPRPQTPRSQNPRRTTPPSKEKES